MTVTERHVYKSYCKEKVVFKKNWLLSPDYQLYSDQDEIVKGLNQGLEEQI